MHTEIVPIGSFSDGDATHRPASPWTAANPTIYLEKLATKWTESKQSARLGVQYYLDRLPDSYALFERPRPGNAKIVDKHLYGHPGHRYFDSPARFYPHFEHLMNNGTNFGCPCTICTAPNKTKMRMPTSSTVKKSAGKPVTAANVLTRPFTIQDSDFVDEEGIPDTTRILLERLQRAKELNVDLQERLSMDWRTEDTVITGTMKDLRHQPAWLPRVGEVVLFFRDAQGADVSLHPTFQEFKFYKDGQWQSHPLWEAGVVGQVPEVQIKEADLILNDRPDDNVVVSGLRLEPLPDPDTGASGKFLTKQYKYVHMHNIRPFVLHDRLLHGIEKEDWHPTIFHALKIMSTVSLVSRYHFQGKWPTAKISCRGLFLGSELLCCGDTVQLLPKDHSSTTVLNIDSIKLEISNLDKGSIDDDDAYNSTIYVYGQAFTTSAKNAYKDTKSGSITPPILAGYSDVHWYPLHDPSKRYKVSLRQIGGRLYEANALLLWLPASNDDAMNADLKLVKTTIDGVSAAREHSSQNYKRIIATGKEWYWGDSRAETLDIESLNGIDMSSYDAQSRQEKAEGWENALRVLNGKATAEDRMALKLMASAKTKMGAAMSLQPTISANDVAEAAKEEGMAETELLKDEQSTDPGPQSDQTEDSEMDDVSLPAPAPVTSSPSGHGRTIPASEESPDELDPEESIIADFGLGHPSPAAPAAPAPTSTKSAPQWPAGMTSQANGTLRQAQPHPKLPSNGLARVVANRQQLTASSTTQPLGRPRGRPPKIRPQQQSQRSSLKRTISVDLTDEASPDGAGSASDSVASSHDTSGVPDALAAFKRQKTGAGPSARKPIVSRQKPELTAEQIAHRKEVIDMLNDNEEDDNEYDSDGQVITRKISGPSRQRPIESRSKQKPTLTAEQIAHRKNVIDMLNDHEEDDNEYDSDGKAITKKVATLSRRAPGISKQKPKLTAEQIAHRKNVIDMLNDDEEDDNEYDSDGQVIPKDGAGALAAFKHPVKQQKQQKNSRNGVTVVSF